MFRRLFPLLLALAASAPLTAAPRSHEPRLSWLENASLRMAVDLELGGAITWVSAAGTPGENLINSYDWGRQVQLSFYGGPIPFLAGAKRPAAVWETLGWNPIQAGDHFGHRSRVLETSNDGSRLYVKCIPMQWPMDDVPSETTFESWLELDGPSVCARARLVNTRADHTPYEARLQELPAVYTNGPYHRLLTYTGDAPGSGAPLTEISPHGPPQWGHWLATEHWSALVNDAGWGLGVYQPDCLRCSGGFNDRPGVGGPQDNPCGYLAPNRDEILDHNLQYDFAYELIVGPVEIIRARAVEREKRRAATPPAWSFAETRAGWYYRGAADAGWPLGGSLRVQWSGPDPQLLSPQFLWKPGGPAELVLEANFHGPAGEGEIFWATLAQPGFDSSRRVRFPMPAKAGRQTYRLPLPLGSGDSLLQLRLDPPGGEGGLELWQVALQPSPPK